MLPDDILELRNTMFKEQFLKMMMEADEILAEDGRLFDAFPEVF
jgi:hypothetical protein